MYIGKLGDGSSEDDGIYVLLKEVLDNCIDEFVMGFGKQIEVECDGQVVTVRDFGRGIPLEKLLDCSSKINTGAKYDSEAFKKSVGLNGVGIKAVNALSTKFDIQAFREGETRRIEFACGDVQSIDKQNKSTKEENGTQITYVPDDSMFKKYRYRNEFVERMLRYYTYLNRGLVIRYNGKRFRSKDGLKDLLEENISETPLYPIVYIEGNDIEVAFTHLDQYGEDYFSFVNGQHTTQGGTHQAAFREAVVKTIRDFCKKNFEAGDIRGGIVAAISIKVQEPVFESQTKTKLGSLTVSPDGETIRTFVGNFLKEKLDNYLHKHPDVADALQDKIQRSERERKELKGIQKIARERAKKSKVHNRKLRDCRIHLCSKHKEKFKSTLFITEGDSASGSITKARDVQFQGVFSLKGKPLNTFGLTRKVVYENEEFNLIQAALGIEEDLEDLRYNQVVIATDADVDGMHIRLLLITFFLQFFPELIRQGHLFVLQTPLFRVRNKKTTLYCYDETEKEAAIKTLGRNPEITRFKGLGEISPDEFKHFIGNDIRLDPVKIDANESLKEMLKFFMGKNTPTRQEYIIRNLRFEHDLVDEDRKEEDALSTKDTSKSKKLSNAEEPVSESAAA
jgi:topoisomerase-4 subunit B